MISAEGNQTQVEHTLVPIFPEQIGVNDLKYQNVEEVIFVLTFGPRVSLSLKEGISDRLSG